MRQTLHKKEGLKGKKPTLISSTFAAVILSLAGGFNIPKDTMVMTNMWAAHYDHKHWNEPNKFKPGKSGDSGIGLFCLCVCSCLSLSQLIFHCP